MSKYDLVRSHIDFVRQSLREVSDDSNITDEQIYMVLVEARGLIMERRLEKHKEFPEDVYQTICIPLCLEHYHDCSPCLDLPNDCLVLKTSVEIPVGMYDGAAELLRVSTINGREIAPLTEAKHRLRQFRKTGKNNYYYVRMSNKLAIFNVPQNRLEIIKIRGVFMDPMAAQLISGCATKECATIFEASFGTRVSDRLEMRELVLKILMGTQQLPEDVSNNAESVIPTTAI